MASQSSHFDGRAGRRSWAISQIQEDQFCEICGNLRKSVDERLFLVQTMRDQTACAFQELSIFIAECVQVITFHIQHAENVPVFVPHGDDDL
jgi:hypothetical protein